MEPSVQFFLLGCGAGFLLALAVLMGELREMRK